MLEAEQRAGDICNACVLIVKRWRMLPHGTGKNWAHVVDARAGPGHNTKKMMVSIVARPTTKRSLEDDHHVKIVKKKKKVMVNQIEPRVEKFEKIRRKRKNKTCVKRREVVEHRQIDTNVSGFIDLGYWRRMATCCGQVFVGQLGEVMLDQCKYSPCLAHARSNTHVASAADSDPASSPASFIPDSADVDSEKSFIDDDDIDSISFYSDTDSSVSKTSKTDLALHTDDEGFEGYYDKSFTKSIKESLAAI